MPRRYQFPVMLATYAVATVAMTWPVAGQLTERFAGAGIDLYVTLWDAWWVEQVALHGETPLHTSLLFFPDGVSLRYHSVSWRAGLFALPWRVLFGPVAGYNLFFLLETLACALGMFALCKRLTGRADAAFVAGLCFAFAPYRLTQAAQHANLGSLATLPLLLLALHDALETRSLRACWATGLCLMLTLATGAHLFVMGSAACFGLWLLAAVGPGGRGAGFWSFSARLAAITALCCAPLLWQFLGAGAAMDEALEVRGSHGQTDLWAFITPSRLHPLWGDAFETRYASFDQNQKWHAYLGLLPLLLTLCGALAPRSFRSALPYTLGLLGFAALSLGDALRVGGVLHELPLPYDLIGGLSAVRALRSPDRFNLMVVLFLPVVACFGYAALARRARPALLVAVGSLLLLEYLPAPFPTTSANQSRAHRALLGEPEGALLELPLSRQAAKHAMFAQTFHGRALVGGMIARTPPGVNRYIGASPLLRALSKRRLQTPGCDTLDLRAAWSALERDGIRHVLVNQRRFKGEERRRLNRYLPARPVVSDHDTALYRISELARGARPCSAVPITDPATGE